MIVMKIIIYCYYYYYFVIQDLQEGDCNVADTQNDQDGGL